MTNLQKTIVVPDYSVKGAKHGRTWSEEDYRKLRILFGQTDDLIVICNELQRSMSAIIPKIVQLGLANSDYEFDTGNTILRRRIPAGIYVPEPPMLSDREDNILKLNHVSINCRCTTTPILGEEMKAKLIETVTLIHGVRADQKTDMEIQHIASIEADIKALS